MKKVNLTLLLLTLVAAGVLDHFGSAQAVNSRKTRYDTSGRVMQRRISYTFSPSTLDTLWIGFPAEVISVQSVTADVAIQPLGDPDCKALDSRIGLRNIANPYKDEPCVNWGLVTVKAGTSYDFGYGGMIMVIVKGLVGSGTCEILISSRGPR